MGSVLGSGWRSKKRLGKIEIVRRERYQEMTLDTRVEPIRGLIPTLFLPIRIQIPTRQE